MSGPGADATRLTRRLGMLDAVVVGLGAMIGAGGTYVYGREAVDYRGVRKTAWLTVLAAGGAVWLVRTTLMGAARP